jgi:acyl carrier protein
MDEGLHVFGRIFGLKRPQLGVINVDWHQFFKPLSSGRIPALYELLARKQDLQGIGSDSALPGILLEKLNGQPPEKAKDILVREIIEETKTVIRFQGELDPNAGLFELGMDSLLALELRNKIQKLLDLSLPSTLIFDYPTINGLCNYLAEKVLGDVSDQQEEASQQLGSTMEDEALEDLSEEEMEELLLKKIGSVKLD